MKSLMTSLTLLLLLPQLVDAAGNGSFSASAVQQSPGQPMHEAQMAVTPDQVRTAYSKDGQRFIEITDLRSGSSVLLMPDSRTYLVRAAKPQVLEQLRLAKQPQTPCAVDPHAACKRLGEESLYGRTVEKWEMTTVYQGHTYRSLYWIDKARFMPLRQIWADGTVIELQPAGPAQMNNRATEKWQMVTQRTDGQTVQSSQWYDPELNMVIREELPGGYLRELRDIHVGTQDPALFEIPAGYREQAATVRPQN